MPWLLLHTENGCECTVVLNVLIVFDSCFALKRKAKERKAIPRQRRPARCPFSFRRCSKVEGSHAPFCAGHLCSNFALEAVVLVGCSACTGDAAQVFEHRRPKPKRRAPRRSVPRRCSQVRAGSLASWKTMTTKQSPSKIARRRCNYLSFSLAAAGSWVGLYCSRERKRDISCLDAILGRGSRGQVVKQTFIFCVCLKPCFLTSLLTLATPVASVHSPAFLGARAISINDCLPTRRCDGWHERALMVTAGRAATQSN